MQEVQRQRRRKERVQEKTTELNTKNPNNINYSEINDLRHDLIRHSGQETRWEVTKDT